MILAQGFCVPLKLSLSKLDMRRLMPILTQAHSGVLTDGFFSQRVFHKPTTPDLSDIVTHFFSLDAGMLSY